MMKLLILVLLLGACVFMSVGAVFADGKHPAKVLFGNSGPVNCMVLSKDGKTLASGNGNSIILWNLTTGSISGSQSSVCPIWRNSAGNSVEGEVSSLAFSENDSMLLAGCNSMANVRVFDAVTMKELRTLEDGSNNSTNSMAFSPDGEVFASGGETITLWSTRSWNRIGTLKGHSMRINALAFSSSGKELASGSTDRKVVIWDVPSCKMTQVLDGRSRSVQCLAFSGNDETLVSGGNFPSILFWNVKNGVVTKSVATLQRSATLAMKLNQDESLMASGYQNGSLDVWDFPSGERRMSFSHGKSVTSLAFTKDGRMAIAGCLDGKIALWDISSLAPSRERQGPAFDRRQNGLAD